MKEFEYTINDEIGLHARPAGLLCKLVKAQSSKVTLVKGDKSADASRVIALMGMGIKKGDTIKVTVDGEDEDNTVNVIETFFKENL